MSIFEADTDSLKPGGPPFVVSPVKRTHSVRRYLWPFQTRKCLIWTVCLLAGGCLAWTAVILLWLDPGALPWALVGAVTGGMYMGPYIMLPAQMTISSRSDARHHVDDVTRAMLRMGYVVGAATSEPGHIHYEPKLSSKLRWLYWSEQDIDLRHRDNKIELSGPVSKMERLRYHLLKQLDV